MIKVKQQTKILPSWPQVLFFILVAISLLLRLVLVMRGGQLFNPDEYRYLTSREVALEIYKGEYDDAISILMSTADHLGFKAIGIIPALLELRESRDINNKNAIIPAIFFSLFSSLNIIIIWYIALKLKADELEALYAAFFMATSNAMFYYSSHLFPYDIALTFSLLALYIGLTEGNKLWRSIFTGLFAFLTFFTYNGYWVLTVLTMGLHLFIVYKNKHKVIPSLILMSLGAFIPFVLILAISNLYGNDLWSDYISFSKTINNGVFSDGAIIPFNYFWAAEKIISAVWFILFTIALVQVYKRQSLGAFLWIGSVLFIYGSFITSSVILQKFVVYGRLARQMIPFLALTSAYSLRNIQENKAFGKYFLTLVISIVAIQAYINFRAPLSLTYPQEFIQEMKLRYPDFNPPKNLTYFYTPNIVDFDSYRAYYVQFLFPLPRNYPPVEGEVLMRAKNPLSVFQPFWYDEGYTKEERSAFPQIEMIITKVK